MGGAVIYDDAGAADTDKNVLFFLDPTDLTTNGGDVTLTIPSTGIASIA